MSGAAFQLGTPNPAGGFWAWQITPDNRGQVNLPTDPTVAGNVRILDSDGNPIDTTENSHVRVSLDSLVFYDQVDGAALNTNLWTYSSSSMTVVQANGFIGLNAGASIATGAYAVLNSVKSIPLYGSLPLKVIFNFKLQNLPAANATAELGVGAASGVSAPSDGAFFRWTAAGQLFAVLNNGGSETSIGPITGTFTDTSGISIAMPPSANAIHLAEIEIVEDHVKFFIGDTLIADVPVPAGQAYPFNSGRQTLFARVFNGGTSPSLAPQLYIGQVIVNQEDLAQNEDWATVLASLGRGFYQSPVAGFGQTANRANSTSPVAAALSNTVPGYATLGGEFSFAAVAGAITDYALFGFQVPANYQFVCTAITISSINTGAIGSAITPTVLDWNLGVNSSGASLATADSPPASWAPRRVGLGLQSFGLAAAISQMATDISRRFEPGIPVDGGRYLHVIVQIPVGAATASEVIRGNVLITGYFR